MTLYQRAIVIRIAKKKKNVMAFSAAQFVEIIQSRAALKQSRNLTSTATASIRKFLFRIPKLCSPEGTATKGGTFMTESLMRIRMSSWQRRKRLNGTRGLGFAKNLRAEGEYTRRRMKLTHNTARGQSCL
ncbi:hypothetical protein MPH_03849 [Macrophomina phaseolina MS6]|uniref:Uncharacterized protein n=1 Tax=Macrophomina phaseolina (strain MS6) TaxID=1126212 RepID=K2RVK6_MACPH|nr:hypothetical protein MPH_03849 [Macrophomina phaseolina MS6]